MTVLKAHAFVILDSSMVEHSAWFNRRVVGSSPTRGADLQSKTAGPFFAFL